MPRRTAAALLTLLATTEAIGAEPHLDDALVAAARRSLPEEISPSETAARLRKGIWDPTRWALAVSVPRPKATIVLVLLKQSDGTYLAVDVSGVEPGSFGKLGFSAKACERFETTPVSLSHVGNGSFEVVVRTRAWRKGQRFTLSERLLVERDGTVLWR